MEEEEVSLEKNEKKGHYLKGLFIRIIICCSIFLILFIANMVEVQVFDMDTQKLISLVGKNDIVEKIEQVIQNLIK